MSAEQEEHIQSTFQHVDAFQANAALLTSHPASDLPTADEELAEAGALRLLCSIVGLPAG
jgi:hypothetical protein